LTFDLIRPKRMVTTELVLRIAVARKIDLNPSGSDFTGLADMTNIHAINCVRRTKSGPPLA